MKFAKNCLLPCLTLLVAAAAPTVWAGFLEMPDTTEVPEMERESMLKDLDIPSVRERDPDPMAGPRLNVTEFRVQGIVEYPELGITRQSLNELVESIRFEMMSENELLESGYTLDEVSQISDLIAEIEEKKKDTHVGPEEVQRLVFLIREQRQRRGVTLGMIETVADTITRYYRERGFILAKAYIPQQRVRDGIVNLTLLLGNLGEVEVLNNKRYRNSTLKGVFEPVVGEPITASDIETRLFYINDMPGMSAQAYFEPGMQVGDTKLNVNVINEKRFSGNVRVDNHGSINTGKYRLYTDGYWNNPGGYGDQLHIGVLATFEPSDSLYGSLHYRMPLFGPRLSLSFGGSTNDFVTRTLNNLTLSGESRVLDASLNYVLKRSRVKNYGLELRLAEIDTDIQDSSEPGNGSDPLNEGSEAATDIAPPIDFDKLLDATIRTADLVFSFDLLHEKARAMHQGDLRLSYADTVASGNITTTNAATGEKEQPEPEQPAIFGFNYTLLKLVPLPVINTQSRVLLKTTGQYSDKPVPSVSQMALAGPNRMRGFAINSFNADRALYIGADWIFDGLSFFGAKIAGQPVSDLIQPYVFADLGYTHTENVAADQPPVRAELADAGIGLKMSFKNFRSSITYAKALHLAEDRDVGVEISLDNIDEHKQIYFDLLYSF